MIYAAFFKIELIPELRALSYKSCVRILSMLFFLVIFSCHSSKDILLVSPDNKIKLMVMVNTEGDVLYQVFHEEHKVIEPSKLGVKTSLADFRKHLTIWSWLPEEDL